ncbi:MAG TPA: SDR family oxidoreductase [Vicinamibacteria bacterium]|nr:SDR family oxidoreductase [Vicinamibacteria bacterium]
MATARRPRARARSAGRRAVAAPDLPDLSPSRYIARISRLTGEEIPGPVDPDELLVHAHRDKHPLEVAAQFMASRVLAVTGNEARVGDILRRVNGLGGKLAEMAGLATGEEWVERTARRLLGVRHRTAFFKFREPTHLSEKELRARIERLQKDAAAALRARGRRPRLHVLLTGGTGFLGKEILSQAADDHRIEKITAVVRPETLRDPKTKEVLRVLSPAQRGVLLLQRLHIKGARARKFRFVEGDIEKPGLGLDPAEVETLRRELTHVIHCAASVSFDDPYETSYRANVLGCRHALAFSLGVQRAAGSPFVSHVAIETSYIHGRKRRSIAQESALVFPRHFYNNFYELTKAMASIETDRHLVEEGLRVAQLLPSIVIGDSRTGNNRGDTKVVNAPINAFGRAREAEVKAGSDVVARAKARAISLLASGFPGDPTAELNLVPVDRVAAGILAALTVPEAIGNRIHLATDNRIRSEEMIRITREELGVRVRLTDPTLHRTLTLPLAKAVLTRLHEPRLAGAMEKLSSIFGGYSEWGQPVHDVGNDVRLLGLPLRRPDTVHAVRMLCRHNKYVQEFGRVRDPDEVARRERAWVKALEQMERQTGREAGAIGAREFAPLLSAHVELPGFRPRALARARRGEDEAARTPP